MPTCAKCFEDISKLDEITCSECSNVFHYSCLELAETIFREMTENEKEIIMCRVCKDKKKALEKIEIQKAEDAARRAEEERRRSRSLCGNPRQSKRTPICMCFYCCISCSCLCKRKRRQSIGSSDGSFESDPPPSLDEIRSWGKSFDKLMKNSAGRRIFREFLKCEYSEENILFWTACEDLKKIDNIEENAGVIEEKARHIYEDFISILSPREVSLDSRVREQVNKNMVTPNTHAFDEAQMQIYTLMHRDSYPRFVNSPIFRDLAKLNDLPSTSKSKN